MHVEEKKVSGGMSWEKMTTTPICGNLNFQSFLCFKEFLVKELHLSPFASFDGRVKCGVSLDSCVPVLMEAKAVKDRPLFLSLLEIMFFIVGGIVRGC